MILSSSSSSLLLLTSAEGQTLLNRSLAAGTSRNEVVEAYNTRQQVQYNTGFASLVVLINALNVAYRIKYDNSERREEINRLHSRGHRFVATEDDIFSHSKVSKYLKENDITGSSELSLDQLHDVALYLGFGGKTHNVCPSSTATECKGNKRNKRVQSRYQWNNVNQFRTFAKDYVMRPVTGLVVNYNIGEGARFGPLAGYDATTDRFLLMDMTRGNKNGGIWVTSNDLFTAMSVEDENGVPQGLLHVHELLV